jgi:O-antigen ligase
VTTAVISKKDKLCRRIVDWGIVGLIVFSPLPAASVYEWSIFIIQITVLTMMIAYLLLNTKPPANKLLLSSLKWPKYLFIGFFIFILLQIIPLPKLLVKVLSPNSYSFREMFSMGLSDSKFISLSVVPAHTLQQGLEIFTYFLLGFLIIKTVVSQLQIRRIFYALIGMGIFQAFYGLFELYNKNPRILFYKKAYNLDSVCGTFVNRNHLSGYLEMIIPLAIGLIIARIDLFSFAGMKIKEKILQLAEKGLAVNLLLSFSILGMSLAVIFSKSRSGVFVLVFTFILMFEFTVFYFGKQGQQKKWVTKFLKIMFITIIIISLYIGIGATLERFALNKVLKADRVPVWNFTLKIISDFPLVGSGLGTYASVFLAYDNRGRLSIYSHAHNDYLEYLSDLGIIGLLLLLGAVLFIIIKAFSVWRTRGHPEVKGLALGGIVAVINILIHSITDFNLQIPANMLLFTVILSLTIVVVFYKKRSEKV